MGFRQLAKGTNIMDLPICEDKIYCGRNHLLIKVFLHFVNNMEQDLLNKTRVSQSAEKRNWYWRKTNAALLV